MRDLTDAKKNKRPWTRIVHSSIPKAITYSFNPNVNKADWCITGRVQHNGPSVHELQIAECR
ncbi:unnamed protein product, partial [Sphenostylis stenocarpa]